MRASTLMTLLCTLPTALSTTPPPPITNTSALPVHFGVVLYPGFQILDAFSVIDVLNTLSATFGLGDWMQFSVIGERKAPISNIPPNTTRIFGQSVVVTTTYDEVVALQKPLDVLIVPGGYATLEAMPAAVPFIKAVYPRLQYLLTVCAGSTFAAQAGILDGRRATTSKSSWDKLIARGPNVKWQRPARWVEDGNIWTGSGSAAGIDMALAWVGQVYGEPVAQRVGDLIEFRRARDEGDDPFTEIWGGGM